MTKQVSLLHQTLFEIQVILVPQVVTRIAFQDEASLHEEAEWATLTVY